MGTLASRIASACGIVRGKPSNRYPLAQSGALSRSLTRPTMMSSDTSAPLSITFLAASPSGVPAFTAARSMSPVEICGMPNASLMNVACVPLPAPGGPRRISRMEASVEGFPRGRERRLRRAPILSRKQRAHALEVLVRVDARRGRPAGDLDDDAMAVPQRTQLLERLERFDRRRRKRRIRAKKRHSVRIQAVMTIEGQRRRNDIARRGECVARPGNRRAAEVERALTMIKNDLDNVRIERLGRVANRMTGGRDRGVG